MSVHVETYEKAGKGWQWAVIVLFAVIGLVDTVLGESLAIIGFEIFLIPAGAWIVANIALIVILLGPERWQSRA
jgi:hypothetical protein